VRLHALSEGIPVDRAWNEDPGAAARCADGRTQALSESPLAEVPCSATISLPPLADHAFGALVHASVVPRYNGLKSRGTRSSGPRGAGASRPQLGIARPGPDPGIPRPPSGCLRCRAVGRRGCGGRVTSVFRKTNQRAGPSDSCSALHEQSRGAGASPRGADVPLAGLPGKATPANQQIRSRMLPGTVNARFRDCTGSRDRLCPGSAARRDQGSRGRSCRH
jgi:hypothetical protein